MPQNETTEQPLDAMASALAPWCPNPEEARLAAKAACDALVAHGYILLDRRADLDAAGISHG